MNICKNELTRLNCSIHSIAAFVTGCVVLLIDVTIQVQFGQNDSSIFRRRYSLSWMIGLLLFCTLQHYKICWHDSDSQQTLHELLGKMTCNNWKTKRVDGNFSKYFGGPEKGRLV